MSKLTQYYGVKGMVKRFDNKLLDKYDLPARNILKQILGNLVIDNPNQYQQDFIITSDNCKYKYLELQVCSSWINIDYPHKNVFIYARKFKYGNDTLFLTFNKSLSLGYLFDLSSIRDSKPHRLRKYSREFVYDIPWTEVIKVYINNIDELTFELL